MNVLELFAGIGGIGLGLERAGMTVVGQVELDPFCRSVLAKHWPEVPKHDDVRTCVEWWQGQPRPVVHLAAGGFPCQPVSNAGRRLAQDDERWLWPAMAAVIRALRPRWVLLENVPGLLTRGMGDVLGDLAACGYDAEWDCIPAAAVGAHHIRDRVWIVAHTDGEEWRPEARHAHTGAGSETLCGGTAEPRRRRDDVADANVESGGSRGLGVTFESARGRDAGRSGIGTNRLADTDGPRLREQRRPGTATAERATSQRSCGWATEPDVGRVAHGIPRRVDRLRALGNAVVPQVAEHIGRLIVAADSRRAAA